MTIETHSLVDESVLLPNVRVGRNCKIRRAIIDKGCQIPDASVIGFEREYDLKRFHLSPGGIVLVTPEMLGQHLHTGE